MTLTVSETVTSTWNYHLRKVGPEGLRPSGGVGLVALCGKKLGWDMEHTSVEYFMQNPEPGRLWHPCSKCHELAIERRLWGVSREDLTCLPPDETFGE